MPAFIFTESRGRLGQPIDAVLCDPNALGGPDYNTNTPVKITLSDHTPTVDGGRPRRVITNVGDSQGHTTIIVEGSTRNVRRPICRMSSSMTCCLMRCATR